MKDRAVYLKQNVLTEPLFDNWYAWSYLISPATAAMYISNHHLKIMRSFVTAPQTHSIALQNPAMRGGPFINYDAGRAGEIRSLIASTEKEQARLLNFAEAIKALDKMLADEANGFSLHPLYQRVPDILKGYVEMTYDLNNNPSIRFIEGLLYKSQFYDPSSQSIDLSLIDRDDRPFAFSTPRLKEQGRLRLNVPFSSCEIDELYRMKQVPRPFGQIQEALGVREQDEELFASFFTQEAPQTPPAYDGDDLRIRYLGHACILIESKDVSILCDPLISYKCEGGLPRYTYADLPESIDYILITHNHQDHFMFETLLQLRHKTKNIVVPRNNGGGLADPSLKLALQHTGFKNVIEIDEMESVSLEGGAITGLPFPGEHGDLNVRTKIAYLVTLNGKSTLVVADSNNLEPKLYDHIHDLYGDIDALFVGMECDGAPMSWLYGPLLTRPVPRKMDQTRRFDGSNFERALDMVGRLNPKRVYVYAMGQEPWLTFLTSIQYTDQSRPIIESNKLVNECCNRGIVSERLYGFKELHLNGR
jgi:L-ascorbate metabolism protein UlaG (beta-lactamase superfamily)